MTQFAGISQTLRREEVEMFGLSIFLLFLGATAVQSAAIDDALCDIQLRYFDDALSSRVHWALFGEKEN